MEKPADNTYPIHDLLHRRWSPWAFSDRQVEDEKLRSLFEAARWSPSCANMQPWSFIVTERGDAGGNARLVETLTDRNKLWASRSPVLVLTVTKRDRPDGAPNAWASYDLGQSAAHLSVEAVSLGLSVHQMAGFDKDKARSSFGIPENYEPVSVIAIGYPGRLEELPETFHKQQLGSRSRKPLDEFVFGGEWNVPLPAIRTESAARADLAI